VIDGEVVALDADGRPSFNALQNSSAGATIVYYVFDVMVLGGRNVMGETLATRRDLLSREVLPLLAKPVREAPRFDAALADLIAAVRAQGLEGLVAKRLDSIYESGARSGTWRKMRLNRSEECVIGGYTRGGRTFDALILGRYEGGRLVYVARTRVGFHSGEPGAANGPAPTAGDRRLPIRESARDALRPVGRRPRGGEDEGVRVGTTGIGGRGRVRGVDGGGEVAARAVHCAGEAQG
jgi:hypothetical protein